MGPVDDAAAGDRRQLGPLLDRLRLPQRAGPDARFFAGLTGTFALGEPSFGKGATITALRYRGAPHFVVRRGGSLVRRLYRISPNGLLHLVADGTSPSRRASAEIGTSFLQGRDTAQLSYWPDTQLAQTTRWSCL